MQNCVNNDNFSYVTPLDCMNLRMTHFRDPCKEDLKIKCFNIIKIVFNISNVFVIYVFTSILGCIWEKSIQGRFYPDYSNFREKYTI